MEVQIRKSGDHTPRGASRVTYLGDVCDGRHRLSPLWATLTLRGKDEVIRRLGGPFEASSASEATIEQEIARAAVRHTRRRRSRA